MHRHRQTQDKAGAAVQRVGDPQIAAVALGNASGHDQAQAETGREVMDGETGLVRVFDLANVFSVMAIQTEDLASRRGAGFELIGRAEFAEARGCSLMLS